MSSKYNSFAKRLDAAFRAARDEYATAVKALSAATKNRDEAAVWRAETYVGENELRKQRAQAAYLDAEHTFKEAEARIWKDFNQLREELTSELKKAVKSDSAANPDDVDGNALELLKSGILKANDFYGLADKFDGNSTMLRLISKYAAEAADNAADDRAEQGALIQLASMCKDGQSSVVRAWESLSSICDYCSGQAHGRKEPPDYVVSMGKWWEQLAAEAVANF